METGEKQKILLCDDSLTNLRIGQKVLSAYYEVYAMPSAKLMFKCLEKNNIALILLDIEMPETDGFTAIQELKAKEETAKIPVIFLTGNTDVDNVLRGRELGAVDFISKPFSPALLLERVGLQLSQRG